MGLTGVSHRLLSPTYGRMHGRIHLLPPSMTDQQTPSPRSEGSQPLQQSSTLSRSIIPDLPKPPPPSPLPTHITVVCKEACICHPPSKLITRFHSLTPRSVGLGLCWQSSTPSRCKLMQVCNLKRGLCGCYNHLPPFTVKAHKPHAHTSHGVVHS